MKTTIRDLVNRIDKNNKQLQSTPNWEELADVFRINNLNYSNDERLKSYYLKAHLCTDSYVGIKTYFLDDKLVAISNQVGRKYSEEFGFVSQEAAIELKKYLLSLVEEEEEEKYELIEGWDGEVEDTYKITYNTQVIYDKAFYKGEEVEILKRNFESEGINSPNYFHSILIKFKNKEEIVDVRELDFKFNVV